MCNCNWIPGASNELRPLLNPWESWLKEGKRAESLPLWRCDFCPKVPTLWFWMFPTQHRHIQKILTGKRRRICLLNIIYIEKGLLLLSDNESFHKHHSGLRWLYCCACIYTRKEHLLFRMGGLGQSLRSSRRAKIALLQLEAESNTMKTAPEDALKDPEANTAQVGVVSTWRKRKQKIDLLQGLLFRPNKTCDAGTQAWVGGDSGQTFKKEWQYFRWEIGEKSSGGLVWIWNQLPAVNTTLEQRSAVACFPDITLGFCLPTPVSSSSFVHPHEDL